MAAELFTLHAEAPGEQIVERLEEYLARAKAGELSSIAIASVSRDGGCNGAWSTPPNMPLLIGSVEFLKHRLLGKLQSQ